MPVTALHSAAAAAAVSTSTSASATSSASAASTVSAASAEARSELLSSQRADDVTNTIAKIIAEAKAAVDAEEAEEAAEAAEVAEAERARQEAEAQALAQAQAEAEVKPQAEAEAAGEALARRWEAVEAWNDDTSLVTARGFEECPICLERDRSCVLLRACACAVHEGCLYKAVDAAHAQRRYTPECVSIGCLTSLDERDAAALLGATAWERAQRLMIGEVAHTMVRALRSHAPRLSSPCCHPHLGCTG
jgi:hypothetical protein